MSLETLTFDPEGNRLVKISPSALAYLSQRARNTCYDFVMKRFLRSGMTKADLGRRIGKSQAQINHTLASPGNWTIRTLAELLAGIGDEEFIPEARQLCGRLPRNMTQADVARTSHDRLRAELIEGTGYISLRIEAETHGGEREALEEEPVA